MRDGQEWRFFGKCATLRYQIENTPKWRIVAYFLCLSRIREEKTYRERENRKKAPLSAIAPLSPFLGVA